MLFDDLEQDFGAKDSALAVRAERSNPFLQTIHFF